MNLTTPIVVRIFALPLALASLLLSPQLRSQAAANSPAILVDPLPADSAELNRKVKALESSTCNGQYRYHDPPSGWQNSSAERSEIFRVVSCRARQSSHTNQELRNLVEKVWQGQFHSAACQINWAEFTFWSIEALAESEDGNQAELITDGSHVAVRDHDGSSWFLRLLPAAQ